MSSLTWSGVSKNGTNAQLFVKVNPNRIEPFVASVRLPQNLPGREARRATRPADGAAGSQSTLRWLGDEQGQGTLRRRSVQHRAACRRPPGPEGCVRRWALKPWCSTSGVHARTMGPPSTSRTFGIRGPRHRRSPRTADERIDVLRDVPHVLKCLDGSARESTGGSKMAQYSAVLFVCVRSSSLSTCTKPMELRTGVASTSASTPKPSLHR